MRELRGRRQLNLRTGVVAFAWRRWFVVCAASSLAVAAVSAPLSIPMPPPSSGATTQVFFSPGGRTDEAIASTIDGATRRVWVAGYYFTSSSIAKALHRAHARHVDVRVVLDRSQATQRYSSATYFHNNGVPIKINARYPVMHHKFLVVDSDTVGFGSMNFTRSGSERNAENFNLFRYWPGLVDAYASEFQRLERESEIYHPGMVFDQPAASEAGLR